MDSCDADGCSRLPTYDVEIDIEVEFPLPNGNYRKEIEKVGGEFCDTHFEESLHEGAEMVRMINKADGPVEHPSHNMKIVGAEMVGVDEINRNPVCPVDDCDIRYEDLYDHMMEIHGWWSDNLTEEVEQ